MRAGIMIVLALTLAAPVAAGSDGIGRVVLLDARRVELQLPDGTRETVASAELVASISSLLSPERAKDAGQTAGIGARIVQILKAIFRTSARVGRAMARGAVVGWQFGDRFNRWHGNRIVGGAVAFFLGTKAFLILSGGNPIAALIGGAVMAIGGAELAEKLEVAFNILFAVGGVAVGAAAGVTVYVLWPAVRAIARLIKRLIGGGAQLLRAVFLALRNATAEAFAWVKGFLRDLKRALLARILHRGAKLTDAERALVAEIEAALAAATP